MTNKERRRKLRKGMVKGSLHNATTRTLQSQVDDLPLGEHLKAKLTKRLI